MRQSLEWTELLVQLLSTLRGNWPASLLGKGHRGPQAPQEIPFYSTRDFRGGEGESGSWQVQTVSRRDKASVPAASPSVTEPLERVSWGLHNCLEALQGSHRQRLLQLHPPLLEGLGLLAGLGQGSLESVPESQCQTLPQTNIQRRPLAGTFLIMTLPCLLPLSHTHTIL